MTALTRLELQQCVGLHIFFTAKFNKHSVKRIEICLKSSPRLPDVSLCHCVIHSCFLATYPPCALYNYVSIIRMSFKQFFGVIGQENAKPHLIYSFKAPNPLKAITQYTLKFNLLAYASTSLSPRVGLVVSDLKIFIKQPNKFEAFKHVCFCLFKCCMVTPCKLLLHIPEFNQ